MSCDHLYDVAPDPHGNADGLVNDKIGVFMFIRVYHFIRVMRNMTRVYKHRAAVKVRLRSCHARVCAMCDEQPDH